QEKPNPTKLVLVSETAAATDGAHAAKPSKKRARAAGLNGRGASGDVRRRALADARYFDRDLSWLSFNERVLEEAVDPKKPLLERVKFLSIFHSNLDEFYMIRVSALPDLAESGLYGPDSALPSGREILEAMRQRVMAMFDQAHRFYQDDLLPELAQAGV